jgi:Kef-type K+ transport system membrane component KefB
MERERTRSTLEWAGLLVCVLSIVSVAAVAAGWIGLAVFAGLGAFSAGAAAAGTDSRRAGDWSSTPGP